jgi:hypothetical protein
MAECKIGFNEHLTMSQVANKDDMIRLQREEIDRLRAALKKIAAIEDDCYGGDWQEIEEARNIASDALSR